MVQSQSQVPLTLQLDGLRNQQGVVYVALFNAPEGFPDDGSKAVTAQTYPISEIPLTITIEDLPFGDYAITVFHDENEDGKLNTGIFGIPKEGFGFSDDPMILGGPPSFKQASFFFSPDNRHLQISMKYLTPGKSSGS
ncbi:MAG: DUF2141 domain-containing protein [Cyanophyceae cyanobacterium]